MSKESKKDSSNIYIAADGEVLDGARADEARLRADLRTLKNELPPPKYPVTLRLPQDTLPETQQQSDIHVTPENPVGSDTNNLVHQEDLSRNQSTRECLDIDPPMSDFESTEDLSGNHTANDCNDSPISDSETRDINPPKPKRSRVSISVKGVKKKTIKKACE